MSTPTPIAVFCPERFLPYSQTFIYDELCAHTHYEADVFAIGRSHMARFPYPRVHTPHGMGELVRYIGTGRCKRFDGVFADRAPQLVHAHFGTSGVFAYPHAEHYGLPLVVTLHGYDMAVLTGRERFLPHRWPYLRISRKLLTQSAALLGASKDLCVRLRELGAPKERVHYAPMGVDLSRFYRENAPRERLEVTMIGRFVEKKGHRYGIEAFSRARRSLPARLNVVGDGPLLSKYKELVRDLGIELDVNFTGPLEQAAIAEVLSRTDVLLAPSCTARNGDRESGLMVVREASAAEVPVIGTHHGGVPESIEHGRTGFLVTERDVGAMAAYLCMLLESEEMRTAMGAAARAKMAREFSLADRVHELESIYDRALA